MKKVIFLLIAILCLVSCRTASVKDSSVDIETVVPVSLNESVAVQTESVDVVEQPIDEVFEEASEEEISTAEIAAEEISTEEITTEEELAGSLEIDVVENTDDTESSEDIEISETTETSEVYENNEVEATNSENSEEAVVAEKSSQEVPVVQVPSSSNANVNTNKEQNDTVEVNETSFNKIKAFIVKEPLFSIGVFTIFIGVILLIVALIKAIVRTHKPTKSNKEEKDSLEEEAKKKNDGTLDDDEFLRSLLNS